MVVVKKLVELVRVSFCKHNFMPKDVSPELESAVNALIDGMAFVESKAVREIMLRNFIKRYGEVPEEYRDAVYAVLEM